MQTAAINTAELTRVLEHCETHPDQHNQGAFFDVAEEDRDQVWTGDDTALVAGWEQHIIGCVAGWTAILNGWRPMRPDSSYVTKGGATANVYTVARDILGLSNQQAEWLFSWARDLTDASRLAEKFGVDAA